MIPQYCCSIGIKSNYRQHYLSSLQRNKTKSNSQHNKICGRVGIDLNLWDQFGCQDVPAFEFVVRVLQGVVPVFKPLTFGVNAQLYTTCNGRILYITQNINFKLWLLYISSEQKIIITAKLKQQ